jgi:hypothetical protein
MVDIDGAEYGTCKRTIRIIDAAGEVKNPSLRFSPYDRFCNEKAAFGMVPFVNKVGSSAKSVDRVRFW